MYPHAHYTNQFCLCCISVVNDGIDDKVYQEKYTKSPDGPVYDDPIEVVKGVVNPMHMKS